MIRIADSLKLAYTKIRTRKVRLFVTVVVASLLFSILMAGSIIITGATSSFESFSSEGFAKRYIIAGSYHVSTNSDPFSDRTLLARIEQLDKDRSARKKIEAKRLGIDYTPTDADKLVITDKDGAKSLNQTAMYPSIDPLIEQAIKERQAEQPIANDMAAFKKQLHVPAQQYYQARRLTPGKPSGPTFSVIHDGKEQSPTINESGDYMPGANKGLNGITKEWSLFDTPLLTPFLLPKQNFVVGSDGSIPVLASYSASQEALNLPSLAVSATTIEKKQRLEQVRQKIAGVTFDVCYRNIRSQSDFVGAYQQQDEIKKNATNKEYQKPSLVYAPSTTPCASPVVQSDRRTYDEKQLQQKQDEFASIFGARAPKSEIIKLRIVGILPDGPDYATAGFSASSAISMLTSSTLGVSWASPYDVVSTRSALQDIFDPPVFNYGIDTAIYFAEYDSPDVARTILKTKDCVPYPEGMPGLSADQVRCTEKGPSFDLMPYGSASLAIDDFKAGFRQFQLIAAVVVGAIAGVILMGMIGRIIADSRKETAVFRAVGASRLAVAQVYVAYTVYLAGCVALVAAAIGFGVAIWLNSMWSPDASITMAILFNVADLGKQFNFYGLDMYDILLIIATIIGASLVGALLPISSNMRRNPIRDMRDE